MRCWRHLLNDDGDWYRELHGSSLPCRADRRGFFRDAFMSLRSPSMHHVERPAPHLDVERPAPLLVAIAGHRRSLPRFVRP